VLLALGLTEIGVDDASYFRVADSAKLPDCRCMAAGHAQALAAMCVVCTRR